KYWYDALGWLERTVDDNDTLEIYLRDGLGRVVLQRDAVGNETRFAYDDVARTLTITDVELGLNGVLGITQVSSRSIEYDHRNLAVREIDALGNVVSKSYDSRRLEEQRIDPGGLAIQADYDVLGRMVSQHTNAGALSVRVTTEYDANGNVLR